MYFLCVCFQQWRLQWLQAQRRIQKPVEHLRLEVFAQIVKPLTIFAKIFIIDDRLGSEYASVFCHRNALNL